MRQPHQRQFNSGLDQISILGIVRSSVLISMGKRSFSILLFYLLAIWAIYKIFVKFSIFYFGFEEWPLVFTGNPNINSGQILPVSCEEALNLCNTWLSGNWSSELCCLILFYFKVLIPFVCLMTGLSICTANHHY